MVGRAGSAPPKALEARRCIGRRLIQGSRLLPIPGDPEREASCLRAVDLVPNEALECLERMSTHWFSQVVQILLEGFWGARSWAID